MKYLFNDPDLFYRTEAILRQKEVSSYLKGFALLRMAVMANFNLKQPITEEELLKIVAKYATDIMIESNGKDLEDRVKNTIKEALPKGTRILDFVEEVCACMSNDENKMMA